MPTLTQGSDSLYTLTAQGAPIPNNVLKFVKGIKTPKTRAKKLVASHNGSHGQRSRVEFPEVIEKPTALTQGKASHPESSEASAASSCDPKGTERPAASTQGPQSFQRKRWFSGNVCHQTFLVTEIILLGLTVRPEFQPLLFVLFLIVYTVTVLGNMGMIVLIRIDSRLHTPIYFFLTNLAFVDLCYTSTATPQMLTNFLSEKKTISFVGCFIQCYLFIALLLTEFYILAAMAYDRYVAICNPLHYSVKMSRRVCIFLAIFSYVYGFSDGLFQAILTFRMTFCRSNVINHFYCADPPLIKLSCSDTYVKEHAMLISAGFNLSSSLTIILVSYAFIIVAILRIKSAEGRHKAFSTCGSHMMAVTLFYGTLFCMYVRPPTDKTVEKSKVIAAFYTFVSPVLNLLIYSLRNKDVKQALKSVLRRNIIMMRLMPTLTCNCLYYHFC
uniref:olfactory receptor 5M11-like n=1 Tax=Jaculus jaculus TaxID=51337 RepID=UPI001E1B15D9|nr:olfactory receptor 5M11-like [Jaculus jaculus]